MAPPFPSFCRVRGDSMRRILGVWILVLGAVASAQSASGTKTYQVTGRVLQVDGTPFRRANPVVFLHGAITPFNASASVGLDGKFKFKKIPPGIYTLAAAVARLGELRKTVEVGPGSADAKGNVVADIVFERTISWESKGTVSAVELSVPEQAKAEFRRALDCLSRRDIQGAVARLEKAVEIAPQFAVALNQLGTISYQSGQYQQAEDYFRTALKQDPDLYAPLVNLGGALLALKRDKEALETNLEAVKANPGDALAHSQLGKSYYYLGRFDEAEDHLKRAKALDQSHFSFPQIVLMNIYLKRNQPAEAIAEMEEFLKLHPDSDWVPGIRKILQATRARLSAKP